MQPLSLTGKQWILKQDATENVRYPHEILAALHAARGIPLDQQSRPLTSPRVLPDIDRATTRIGQAISAGERVAIFGDYDCDGITATAELVRFFWRRSMEPLVRLPHRIRDGYGLTTKIVEEMKQAGVTLLITADCGVTALDAITAAQDSGIDVIVTDHHHPLETLPKAHAIVHPGLSEDYPLPHPSGAGVAYQLIRAMEGLSWEGDHIDRILAMIGTVADVVELKGDNRTLVREGLNALSLLSTEPLALLFAQAEVPLATATSRDIGFRIAPRINAAGRMDDPLIGLHALLKGGDALATLERMNRERQDKTDLLLTEAIEKMDSVTSDVLVATVDERYPEGIIGLIAGKLCEIKGKPTLVGCIRGDLCTASLRSPACYHITEGLSACSDLLIMYGGHAQAAGCSFALKNFEALKERLDAHIRSRLDLHRLTPSLSIDAALDPRIVTLPLVTHLSAFEPFGQGNPEPLFLLKNVKIDQARTVGKNDAHLQGSVGGIKMVGFRLGSLIKETSHPLDLVCKLGIDRWNGRASPQFFVEDARLAVAHGIEISA
jgi:single-stranded-DNA-specific exonuclease